MLAPIKLLAQQCPQLSPDTNLSLFFLFTFTFSRVRTSLSQLSYSQGTPLLSTI